MRSLCRFLFDDTDAARIDLTKLSVAELPLSDAWAQGLTLSVTASGAQVVE